MSDLRKAAEMALEALSEYTGVVTSGTDPAKWNEVVDGGGPSREAIQALRQALAQPEQEPVAWREVAGRTTKYYDYNEDGKGEPLYTKPPKWQRLTDDEIKEVYVKRGVTLTFNDFARAIEAKLKEKNCG